MILKEKKLQFEFDDAYWSGILKFDETRDYKNASSSLPKTKGVDFTATYQQHTLVMVEVKDFRGHRIKNKSKFATKPTSLWRAVAQKHKDSISVIVGASRNSTHEKNLFKSYMDILKNENKPIHLVLWLEQDYPDGKMLKPQRQEVALQKELKKSLKWLTSKVSIVDRSTNPFSNSLKVSYL